MNSFIEYHKIRLTTISPVFVGSGRELSKKEYLFLDDFKTVGVLDVYKFYDFVRKKGLSKQFEQFFLNDVKGSLRNWVKDKNISNQKIKECLRYTLDCGDTTLRRGVKPQIMEYVKDPYGMPYIPGSSLKGMLRTILLYYSISNNQSAFENTREKIDYKLRHSRKSRSILNSEVKELEGTFFNILNREEKRTLDAKNDCMAGLIIGDSKPVECNKLILCQKVDRKVDGSEKTLNILRECIKPQVTLEFSIIIDKKIFPFDVEDIKKAIQIFDDEYYNCFVSKFAKMDRRERNVVYLGGGSGFVSKTVMYPLYGEKEAIDKTIAVFDKINVPANHKHNMDRRDGVSPHIIKCTRWNDRIYQMGQCTIEID